MSALWPCIEMFAGWPRPWTFWWKKKEAWFVSKRLLSKQEAVWRAKRGEPVGVWQCFAAGGNNCAYRDVIAFKLDARECLSLECVLAQYKTQLAMLAQLLEKYKPLVWYDGGKSVYFVVLIQPVDADWQMKPEWGEGLVNTLGLDVGKKSARHGILLPCTPHPQTGRTATWLDHRTLEPVPPPNALPPRVDPRIFLT